MAHTDILLEVGTNEVEVVVFYIDEAVPDGAEPYRWHFGLNVAKVLEIIRKPEKIMAVPEVPHPCVMGAFNQRDQVVPLVDLSSWLNIPMAATDEAKVVVTEFNKFMTAFMVSGVNRIHRLSWESIEPPSEHVAAFSEDSVVGVIKLENRVIFLLDLEKVVGELNPLSTIRMAPPLEFDIKGEYKALIADDSNTVRRMIRSLLTEAGFEVKSINNGRGAWEWLWSQRKLAEAENRPVTDLVNVVVTDIEMPQMDGHTLCKRLKSDPVLKDLPIILFSSLITERLRHKGESVGADAQISKPDLGYVARIAAELIETGTYTKDFLTQE